MYFDDRAEQATLGSCLIGKTPSLDEAREIVEPDDFYREPHKMLFQALIEMQKKGIELDLVTVKAELESKGKLEAVGGLSYIMQLMNVVPTPPISAITRELFTRKAWPAGSGGNVWKPFGNWRKERSRKR